MSEIGDAEHARPALNSSDDEAAVPDAETTGTQVSLSTIVPPKHLLHPAFAQTLSSRPAHISFLLAGALYKVTLDQGITEDGLPENTNEPWICFTSTPAVNIHFECIFLRPDAFRVRVGLADYFPFGSPFPVDPEFPPPHLRQYLFPDGCETEPIAGAQREDINCGLMLRPESGDIWVNPRGSSFELSHTSSPFGIKGYYMVAARSADVAETERESDREETDQTDPSQRSPSSGPFFQQASEGPFHPLTLPSGFITLENGLTFGTDLFILQEGETLLPAGPGVHTTESKPTAAENSQTQQVKVSPLQHTSDDWGLLLKRPAFAKTSELNNGQEMLSIGTFAGDGVMDT